MLAWNARQFLNNNYLLFIGIAYLFIAGIDLMHTLAFKGMGVFKGIGANHPTQLWIAARSLQSISLLIAPVFIGRRLNHRLVFGAYLVVTSLLLWSIFGGNFFPDCYVDGVGLTPFKKNSEYVISLVLLLSAVALHRRKRDVFNQKTLLLIYSSIGATIVSELAFTFYIGVYDISNLVGHLFKIAAFYLIYLAIIKTGIKDPFDVIFRSLTLHTRELQAEKAGLEVGIAERTRDLIALSHQQTEEFRALVENAPDPILRYDRNGRCIYANPALASLTGTAQPPSSAAGACDALISRVLDSAKVAAWIKQAVASGETIEGQIEFTDTAGDLHYFHTRYVPERDQNRNVATVLAISTDVTSMVETERQLRTLVENLPDMVARFDREGRHIYVSPVVERIFQKHAQHFLGKTLGELALPETENAAERLFQGVMQAILGTPNMEVVTWPLPSGTCSFEVRHIPEKDSTGKVVSVLAVSRDITEQQRKDNILRQLSAAVEQSPVSVFITDTNGAILYVNPAFCANTGYTIEEVLGKNPRFLSGGYTKPQEYASLWRTIKSGIPWRGTFHNRRKDGTGHWVEAIIAPIRDASGAVTQFVSIQQDITARKQAEERVEFLAHHDALTGLANRLLGRDRMETTMKFAERQGCKVALMFLDLDGFKRINDALGHGTGDQLLRALGMRLQQRLRKTDSIARQGGDEFLITIADVHETDMIVSVARKLLEEVARPFTIEGHELSVSGSLGIAVYPDDGRDWETLCKKADVAMYSAKESSPGTYRFFTEKMNANADVNLRLRTEMRLALQRGEFLLHYQPQFDLRTNQVVGVEALLRWNNPQLGVVAPSRFVPVAEDTGLIVPVGNWVLEEACRQAMAWRQAGLPPIVMAVNLSAVQFRSGNVLASVEKALADSGLEPSGLELELTESILIKETSHVLGTVNQLKALGTTLAIDDFGTGFSSLSYLKRFNPGKVKIDQSFVRDVTTDANSAAIVTAIVQMARSLGMITIAEGVSDAYILEALRQRGCEQIQGFYFAEPMSAEDISAFLRNHNASRYRADTPGFGVSAI